MLLTQAVVWTEGDGVVRNGRLDVDDVQLSLTGSDATGRLAAVRLPYERLAGVRIGRSSGDRVGGAYSLVLDRRGGDPIRVAAVGGTGTIIEAGDLIAELVAEHAVERIAVVLPLRPGSRERALALVAKGPPFDPVATPFRRHDVYVTDTEVVFVFEGPDVRRAAERLLREPGVWRAAAGWRACLSGRPRIAEEGYAWARPASREDAAAGAP